jgi:hypothetical protein
MNDRVIVRKGTIIIYWRRATVASINVYRHGGLL